MSKNHYFKDKVIVITGSSQGIGYRTAELLALKGAKVVINSRNEQKVQKALLRLRAQGLTIEGLHGDVSDHDFCVELRDFVINAFGKIDFLINNAGLASKGNLSDTRPEVYQMIFNVNVLGSLYPTLAMIEDLKCTKGGVLFISSLAGILGLPSYSAYSGTKGAIIKLAESLKNELYDHDVYVGVNHPGFTENDADKVMITGSGEAKSMTKRKDVKVDPLDKTVGRILDQIESRKFRAFSSGKGKVLFMLYRLSPSLCLYILRLNRHKIMEMQ